MSKNTQIPHIGRSESITRKANDTTESDSANSGKSKSNRLTCKFLDEKMTEGFKHITELINTRLTTQSTTLPSMISAPSSIAASNRLFTSSTTPPNFHNYPLQTQRNRTQSCSFLNTNIFNEDENEGLNNQPNIPDFYVAESIEWNNINLSSLHDKLKNHLFAAAANGNIQLYEFLFKIVTDRNFHDYNWMKAQMLLFERGNHLSEDEKRRCLDTIAYKKRGRRSSYTNHRGNYGRAQNWNSTRNPTRPRSQERATSQSSRKDFRNGRK